MVRLGKVIGCWFGVTGVTRHGILQNVVCIEISACGREGLVSREEEFAADWHNSSNARSRICTCRRVPQRHQQCDDSTARRVLFFEGDS